MGLAADRGGVDIHSRTGSTSPPLSVAKSAGFPQNWATLKSVAVGCFSCPRVEANLITWYLASVEELGWCAESQVIIPAEHLWCDFKCRPWAKKSSPNTNDLYIHYMDKSTGTPPSLEEKKGTTKLWQQRWKHNSCTYKLYFPLCCNSFEVYEMTVPICTSHWCLVMNIWDSAGIRTWLSADQSSSSTLTESSFLFDSCLIHKSTVMLE